jgi:hypothetical protein
MSASMDYGHNDDLRLLGAKVDPERKACHQRTACVAVYYRILQGLFRDKLKSRERFV